MSCKHLKFQYSVKVHSTKLLVDREGTEIDRRLLTVVRVWCADCKAPFVFLGPEGYATDHPTVGYGTEVRAPMLWPLPGVGKPDDPLPS